MLWSLVFFSLIGCSNADHCNTQTVSLTGLTTKQSSNYKHGSTTYSSERAIDGDTEKCAITQEKAENTPWWRIDLQGVYSISCISIYNVKQTQHKNSRSNTDLNGAQIHIGNSQEENRTMYKTITNFTEAKWNNFTSNGGVSGRYINVSFPGTNPLILCEVKIYGKDSPFVLIEENKTWEEALYYCRKHHTDLASILDEEMQTWAELEARKAQTEYVWLGLRYTCTLDFWFWIEDHRLEFSRWAEGSPAAECDMSVAMQKKEEHRWFRKNDTETFNFICKKKYKK